MILVNGHTFVRSDILEKKSFVVRKSFLTYSKLFLKFLYSVRRIVYKERPKEVAAIEIGVFFGASHCGVSGPQLRAVSVEST